MSFVANIPTTGQTLGNSRPQVNGNFAALRAQAAVNHADVNDGNSGKHTFIQWVAQGSDPTTAANEIARYTKLVTGIAYEHLRQPGNGSIFQMTGPTPQVSTTGCTFLAGGLLMQWGLATVTGTIAIVFPIAFSAAAYSIQGTQFNAGSSNIREFPQVFASSATGFTLRMIEDGGGVSGSARTVYWLAIGKQ